MREFWIEKYTDITETKILWWRVPVHYLLVGVLILIHLFAKRQVKVISDERIPTDKLVICTCTHIRVHDVESTFETT